jgi:hypothetical protein
VNLAGLFEALLKFFGNRGRYLRLSFDVYKRARVDSQADKDSDWSATVSVAAFASADVCAAVTSLANVRRKAARN